MVIFRKLLLKYIFGKLKITKATKKIFFLSNQSYHLLRGNFVLGTFDVLHLIFTPILKVANISTIFQKRKLLEMEDLLTIAEPE